MTDLADRIQHIQSESLALTAELRRRAAALASVPIRPDYEALMLEVMLAEDDAANHFKRHPRVGGEGPYEGAQDPVGCEEDWKRCCRRKDAAVGAIVAFMRTRREGQ